MDKETVIKGCENWVNNHKGENFLLTYSSVVELLAVLKEQNAVEPIIMDHIVFGTSRKCSKCNQYLFPAGKYCPHCGKVVKWE